MPAAARAVPLPRLRALPPLPGTGALKFLVLVSETLREAKAAARAAHQKFPFADW